MHVCFVEILLPQFLTNILANTLLFEVGHLHVRFGTLDTRIRDNFWHLCVGEGSWCLGHDGWLTVISVGCPKVPLQLLHCPGKPVQGSCPKFEYAILQVTAPTLEVGLGFRIWTLVFGLSLLIYVLLGLGCLALVFVC